MLRKSVQTIWTASRHAEVAPAPGSRSARSRRPAGRSSRGPGTRSAPGSARSPAPSWSAASAARPAGQRQALLPGPPHQLLRRLLLGRQLRPGFFVTSSSVTFITAPLPLNTRLSDQCRKHRYQDSLETPQKSPMITVGDIRSSECVYGHGALFSHMRVV
jgi:hypothetical protein